MGRARHLCWGLAIFVLLSRCLPGRTLLGPAVLRRAGPRRAGPGPAPGAAGRRRAATATARAAGETELLSSVDAWLTAQPYQSAFFVASVKATASDLLAQKGEKMAQASSQRRPLLDKAVAQASGKALAVTGVGKARDTDDVVEDISWRRTLAFFLYGGLYQGCAQYFIFNTCYPVWFGEGQDFLTVAEKVLFDQFVLTPFLCLPVAYLIKALTLNADLPAGMRRYVEDAGNDLLIKYWLIWGPVQCLTFGVVPPHWRIPFIALVSFFWLIVLSSISSRRDAEVSSSTPADAVAEA